jgi:hypothetical protein
MKLTDATDQAIDEGLGLPNSLHPRSHQMEILSSAHYPRKVQSSKTLLFTILSFITGKHGHIAISGPSPFGEHYPKIVMLSQFIPRRAAATTNETGVSVFLGSTRNAIV